MSGAGGVRGVRGGLVRGARVRGAGASRVVRVSRGRRVLTAALAALATVALAACQAIPSTGPVREGLTDLYQAEQPVQFNPGGPAQDATQEEIVRGFVRAASSSSDDYAIAREYLAPTYAESWDPSHGVFIDEGNQSFRSLDDNIAVLGLSGVATVDELGALAPVQPGAATEARFELVRVGGQWRIASAPAGIILDRSTFTAVWSSLPLYFLTPDGRLSAETRWYLNRATLTTQVVSGLLAGPSAEMVGVLQSAFPSGTVLSSSSVPVVDGIARIDLSPALLVANAEAMESIKRQIAASLQSIPGVSSFELLVDGVVIERASVTSPEDDGVGLERFTTAVVADGVFGQLVGGEVQPFPALSSQVVGLDPLAVTVSRDHLSAAVLNTSGVTWVSDAEAVQLDVRAGLIAPTLDRFGYVWSYTPSPQSSSTAPTEIVVTKPGESQQTLQMPSLAGRVPVAVRVAKNGMRLAVLVADGDQSAVVVVGIVREGDGRPIAFGETSSVQLWASGEPVDLDWVDDQRFAALTRVGAAGRVTLSGPGQFAVDAGTVSDAVHISGGGSRAMLRVLSDNGRLFAPQGVGWQRQEGTFELLAKTG